MINFYLSGLFFLIYSLLMFIFSLFFLIFKMYLFIEWEIYSLNSVSFLMYIYLDWMTLLFIFTVLFISSMIMIYCSEYMCSDNYLNRFYYLMLFFIISMILMIISPNIMSIILGWDGLGLISYCLVTYYQNFSSFNSGMVTILLNRIGDVMIIISVIFMFNLGSWNFLNFNFMEFFFLLMVMTASFTKSAQFPFSYWLPAAMAAPTPVSSLVHSSTLVTAGIYLMIRFNNLIYKNDFLIKLIFMVSLVTMLMAGFSANFEFDMKKIIAFSTLSQLGLMMMIYSMKFYMLSYFHLIIHAMFKSMMFMCSGVFIHIMINYQDIRFLSKLNLYMPLTSMTLMISNFSLCGLPFMSGFYSKDKILEFMLMSKMSFFSYLLLLLATMLTIMYSFRLIYYLMNENFLFFSLMNFKEFKMMNYPMMFLLLMSLMFGSLLNWLLFYNIDNIFLLTLEKNTILLICILSLILMKYILMKKKLILKMKISYFLGKMYFYYNLNSLMINLISFGKLYMNILDKGWSEYIFKNLINEFLNNIFVNFIKKMIFLIFSLIYLLMMIYYIF